jgi:hypothetical protein
MSDYLTSLVARHMEVGERLQPRLASSFEAPARLTGSAGSSLDAEVTDEPLASVPEPGDGQAGHDVPRSERRRQADSVEASTPEVHERLASIRGLERPAQRGARFRSRTASPHHPALETPVHVDDSQPSPAMLPASPPPIAPLAPGQAVPRSAREVPQPLAARPAAPAEMSRAGAAAQPRNRRPIQPVEPAPVTVAEERPSNRPPASPPVRSGERKPRLDGAVQTRAAADASSAVPVRPSTASAVTAVQGSTRATSTMSPEGVRAVRAPAEAGPRAESVPGHHAEAVPGHRAEAVVSGFNRTSRHSWDGPMGRDDAPTTVHVTIGRIEVRATPPAKPAPAAPSTTAGVAGLDEYLRRRAEGNDR